ncbi:patatin-like phospholipase family protein [Longibacter salinarum]|nr:patatin-like phospholipase family protein [Longibacter salinarum]
MTPTLALMLSGGGARSAFQAGVLRYISEAFPGVNFPVLTGISAGAINTAQIANHVGPLDEAAERLEDSWRDLDVEDVFEVESGLSILWSLLWNQRDKPESASVSPEAIRRQHGLLDTTPLWHFLSEKLGANEGILDGVSENLRQGRLRAAAVITTNYTTGQTVTWVQGQDFDVWERPNRISIHAELTVDHVMASTSLPLVFPAVQIGDSWYGDGGIRLSAPLAPAVHLGADRILAISNHYPRSRAEADAPSVIGYPPTAQIIGLLMNAIFADTLDQDAYTLERVNRLVNELPRHRRMGMREIQLLRLRPSVDLAQLAYEYKDQLPASVRFLTSGLGASETRSPDWMSVLLFLPDYIDRLMDIGYHDAKAQHDELEHFFSGIPTSTLSQDSTQDDDEEEIPVLEEIGEDR